MIYLVPAYIFYTAPYLILLKWIYILRIQIPKLGSNPFKSPGAQIPKMS